MRRATVLLVCALVVGCAPAPVKHELPTAGSFTVIPTNVEPAAQLDKDGAGGINGGAVIGGVGGAGVGAAMGQASAGILCTIGGPLCAFVVVPAVIFGGLIGGTAGAIGDATKDRIANEKREAARSRADTSARLDE